MSYDLLSETRPIARKDHRCIWCGQKIEKGTKYDANVELRKALGERSDDLWDFQVIEEGAKEILALRARVSALEEGLRQIAQTNLGYPLKMRQLAERLLAEGGTKEKP